mmetsp:Transcript_18292/g.27408  ORF Transcript_18292/g.27408 Transcript_18292/m.27408 type:complete len:134 (+) Transcript_18292:42-443(+)
MPLVKVKNRGSDGKMVCGIDEKIVCEVKSDWVGGDKKSLGSGTLFVTTKSITWLSSENKELGYSLDYPSLTMHAISKDSKHFKNACIYGQIGFEGDDFYIVIAEESEITKVYDTICQCSALHPDEDADNDLVT